MRSPSLVLINDSHLFVSGEVVIHPTAAIASGVLLQADPGCRVVVGAGVCVGSGSVLHAHQGDLVIEVGAILGSGVLIVGSSTIGKNACIGALTTILGCSVQPGQFVPAESLLGDRSRQLDSSAQSTEMPSPAANPPVSNRNGSAANPYANSYSELDSPWSSQNGSQPQASTASATSEATPPEPTAATSDRNGSQPAPTAAASPTAEQPAGQQVVYGRAYIEKMMIRMFPHRQALDSSSEIDSS